MQQWLGGRGVWGMHGGGGMHEVGGVHAACVCASAPAAAFPSRPNSVSGTLQSPPPPAGWCTHVRKHALQHPHLHQRHRQVRTHQQRAVGAPAVGQPGQ